MVKLGPPKPVLPRVVDFCSPQSVFGGQTIKLTCHLALKFDLSTYLQTMTLCPHTHVHGTHSHTSTRARHSGPDELTGGDAVRRAKKLLWSLLPWASSVSVSLEDDKGTGEPLVYEVAAVCLFCGTLRFTL